MEWRGGGIRNRSRARGLVAERASERARARARERGGTWNVARSGWIKTERRIRGGEQKGKGKNVLEDDDYDSFSFHGFLTLLEIF